MLARKSLLADLIAKTRDPDVDPGFDEKPPPPSSPPPGRQAPSTPPRVADQGATERVHTSIYLSRSVRRELRLIAAAEECKVHDLMIEAIEALIRHRRARTS